MFEILLPCVLVGSWAIFSLYYLRKAYKYPQTINTYVLESIPSVFPTIGILCTFIGVFLGLLDFDSANIQNSIPILLNGLKLAFVGSMLGILGLLIFQKILAVVQKSIDIHSPIDELSTLKAIKMELETSRKTQEKNSELLASKIAESIFEKFEHPLNLVIKTLSEVKENENINSGVLINKFEEFGELLKKNNTEALVQVMERVTTQFNAQMSSLINRLVQENFAELNNSVKNLNTWQQQNFKQIEHLTSQYELVYKAFQVSNNSIDAVSANLTNLTKEEGKLVKLVNELEKVMITDNKFTSATEKMTGTVEKLESMTNKFNETSNQLNSWIVTQRNFTDKTDVLIAKIEELRNLESDVWKKYRGEMEKSVKIIHDINESIESVNKEFYEKLNNTFSSLDDCIQRFVPKK
jgi:hypothetical protein